MRRKVTLLFVFMLLFLSFASYGDRTVSWLWEPETEIYINDRLISGLKTSYVDPSGFIQVPVELVQKITGGKLTLDIKNKKAKITTSTESYEFTTGSRQVKTNTGDVTLQSAVHEQNNTLYLPIATLADSLGYSITNSYIETDNPYYYDLYNGHSIYLNKKILSTPNLGVTNQPFEEIKFSIDEIKSQNLLKNFTFYSEQNDTANVSVKPYEIALGTDTIYKDYFRPKLRITYDAPGLIRVFNYAYTPKDSHYNILENMAGYTKQDFQFIEDTFYYLMGDEGKLLAQHFIKELANGRMRDYFYESEHLKASTFDEYSFDTNAFLSIKLSNYAKSEKVNVYYQGNPVDFGQEKPFIDENKIVWLPVNALAETTQKNLIANANQTKTQYGIREYEGVSYIAYSDLATLTTLKTQLSYGYDFRAPAVQPVIRVLGGKGIESANEELTFERGRDFSEFIIQRDTGADRLVLSAYKWQPNQQSYDYLKAFYTKEFAHDGATIADYIIKAIKETPLPSLHKQSFYYHGIHVTFNNIATAGYSFQIETAYTENLITAYVIDIDPYEYIGGKTLTQKGYNQLDLTKLNLRKTAAFRHMLVQDTPTGLFNVFAEKKILYFGRLHGKDYSNEDIAEIAIKYVKKGEIQIQVPSGITRNPNEFIHAGLKLFLGEDGDKIADSLSKELNMHTNAYMWLTGDIQKKPYKIGAYTLSFYDYENRPFGHKDFVSTSTIKITFPEK